MLASSRRAIAILPKCAWTGRSLTRPYPFIQACVASSDASPKRRSKREVQSVIIDTKDIPQGLINSPEGNDGDGDGKELETTIYPTTIQQARNNMRKFSHCVVLTRVGSFYELYFEQAEEYGPLLGLKIGSKRAGSTRVPMAGFPFFQLDRYLKYLVQDHGKYVAISEETLNDPAQRVKSGGLKNDRQVKRVITPGTLIDENFLNPYEHNYLLAINVPESQVRGITCDSKEATVPQQHLGISWLDLSSGDFFTQSVSYDNASSAIARISPREIILDRKFQAVANPLLSKLFEAAEHVITYHMPTEDVEHSSSWESISKQRTGQATKVHFTEEEVSAAKLLLNYAASQLPGTELKLQTPIQRHGDEYMSIDRNSLRGLEVLKTMRDGLFKGSLLHAVRRTSTESGARLLANRLTSPSSSYEIINDRLDLVEALLEDEMLLEGLVSMLRETCDTLRLVQKFSFGRGDADDLLALSRTVAVTNQISSIIYQHLRKGQNSIQRLADRLDLRGPSEVAEQITNAIDEEGLMLKQRSEESEAAEVAGMARSVIDSQGPAEDLEKLQKKLTAKRFTKDNSEDDTPKIDDIWVMRPGASLILHDLHDKLSSLLRDQVLLERSLQKQLGADSLALKFAPGLGHFCHVKGRDTRIDLSELSTARTVSSTKSTKSFYISEWTTLGGRIDNIKIRIRAEETVIFQTLRESLIKNLVPLRRNASVLDELDVAASFARLASELHLTRPILNHSQETKIFGGRHIMVDAGLTESGKQFTPNDCHLQPSEKIWLITGPNMAGKSTFLRQTALISILAQTGSFVPADYAEIGIVDQIFSRVGSADDLSREQSTFMVEMLETSAILRQATARSFVIMDEVGRGTTPEDGTAVGFAVLKHLREVNECRALFATHFHALANMTNDWIGKGLGAYCTDVKEETDGAFRYDHHLRSGVNRESHALKVARLAGMPEEAIKTAKEVLEGSNR